MIEYTVEVYDNGTRHWFLNGEIHREDGPAVEYVSGTLHWYLNGKPHREDGPAFELYDGSCYWYLNGEEYTEKEFIKKTAKAKELRVAEIESLLGYSVKVVNGK